MRVRTALEAIGLPNAVAPVGSTEASSDPPPAPLPTNPASAVRVLNADLSTAAGFSLSWVSVGGTRYRIQYVDDLTEAFQDLVRPLSAEMDPSPYGSPSIQTFIDTFQETGVPPDGSRFYRIRIAP